MMEWIPVGMAVALFLVVMWARYAPYQWGPHHPEWLRRFWYGD